MPVTADQQLDVALFDGVHQLEIIEDRGVLRIVVDQDDGLFPRQGAREGIEPHQALMGNQGRRHPHVRAAVAAQELDAARLEFEMLIAEDLGKGIATTLRPFCIVIAGHEPVGVFQRIEHRLGHRKLSVCTEIGDVPAEQRKLDVRLAVDVGDASFEVLNPPGGSFADMDIAQISEFDRRRLRRLGPSLLQCRGWHGFQK